MLPGMSLSFQIATEEYPCFNFDLLQTQSWQNPRLFQGLYQQCLQGRARAVCAKRWRLSGKAWPCGSGAGSGCEVGLAASLCSCCLGHQPLCTMPSAARSHPAHLTPCLSTPRHPNIPLNATLSLLHLLPLCFQPWLTSMRPL